MRNVVATVLISSTLLASSGAIQAADKETSATDVPAQSAKSLDVTVTTTLNYLLYLPADYASESDAKKWPLMLFLHGAGERGDNIERVKVHGPPKLIENGESFPFLVVSPQCPANGWWDSRLLLALIDEIVETHNVDENRIYLTGLSMGGYGSWDLLSRAPDRFAAAAPICGGGIPYLTKKYPQLPIWVFHGAKDFVVPISASEAMVKGLKKNGGSPKFTIYPNAGHDSWTETYANDELYEWFLSQSRE